MPRVRLVSATENPMELLKLSAGECYQKEATDKVIEHIINAGHLSVLEHCHATFEVTCSITVLLQLTRHRHFSFTVQSSRGSKLEGTYSHPNATIDLYLQDDMNRYNDLLALGHKCEDVAYLLPKGAEYKLIITGNFRAWFEYLPKRLCKRASREHRQLAMLLLVELVKLCPDVFQKVQMNCKTCNERGCSFA